MRVSGSATQTCKAFIPHPTHRAAASAYDPPDPIAMMPSLGSMTSPEPVTVSDTYAIEKVNKMSRDGNIQTLSIGTPVGYSYPARALHYLSVLTWLSTTSMTASSLRRYFSVRHSLASSTHARVNWPGWASSLDSSRSRSARQSAVEPANPEMTPSPMRRTLTAIERGVQGRPGGRREYSSVTSRVRGYAQSWKGE